MDGPKYMPDVEKKVVDTMKGMTVAITGCTSGTGFEVAKRVAAKGARVLLLNRKSARSQNAEDDVKKGAATAAEVITVGCDLMDFASVREAAAKVKELSPAGLDRLVLNAGVMMLADKATKDGYDVQMQTNHLSHFLLTRELLPSLNKAVEERGEARIITVSSKVFYLGGELEAQYLGKNGGNLGGDHRVASWAAPSFKRYQQSKLANSLFSKALHFKLQEHKSKVKSIHVHPGVAKTSLQTNSSADGEMHRDNGGLPTDFDTSKLMHPEDGAASVYWTTAAKDCEMVSGEFYGPKDNDMGNGPPEILGDHERFTNIDAQKLMWGESEKAVGKFLYDLEEGKQPVEYKNIKRLEVSLEIV